MHPPDSHAPIRTPVARIRHMATAPPSDRQLWHLERLGYDGPQPENKLKAAMLIERRKREQRELRLPWDEPGGGGLLVITTGTRTRITIVRTQSR